MQCSSIGSLGGNPGAWAMSELANSLGPMNKDVKVIFPSKKNVMDSLDGILGGQCLPYNRQTHIKQEWLRDYLYQWKSDKWQRTRAIPHIKTYAQVSGSEAAFLLLTSSNLSKAAWGSLNKARGKLYIMSYEAGVLLLPKFVNGKESFDLSGEELILPYDLPETKYDNTDTPWFWNYLNE
jgi:tyrosyl-DNA phosphodiesterase-1